MCTAGRLEVEWLDRQGDKPYPVPLLPGGCLAMRRDTFEAIGGFDAAAIRCGPCAEWCPVHVITMEAYHLVTTRAMPST